MRLIIDVDDIGDARKCLALILKQQELDDTADFGYWCSDDPDFSAYIRLTKTGVSAKGRRKKP
jgi:hypothetical protein